VVLDTHVWLWLVSEPERLAVRVRERLARSDSSLFLSAASSWEIAIKNHHGKLALPRHPREFIAPRLLRDGIQSLPISHAHAAEVAGLPDHHTDPFDRLLVAQCRVEGLALATVDRKLAANDVPLLRADVPA
jgi:PIN domain nuclease of toxin-antitoxin system